VTVTVTQARTTQLGPCTRAVTAEGERREREKRGGGGKGGGEGGRGRKGKEEKRREKEKGERGERERERERKERKRGRSRGSYDAAAVDVEIDPQSCRFRRSQTHCALQAIVERRAAVAKRIAVLLRWHSDGGEVRRGLSTGLGGPVRKSGPRIDTIQSCAFRGP